MTTAMQRLFSTGIPITEKVVRTVVVYGAVLFLLRLGGKRTAGQVNSFDLVVLPLISNVVQNAIVGPENSLVGGVIGATVLVVVDDLVSRRARPNDTIVRAMEGTEGRTV